MTSQLAKEELDDPLQVGLRLIHELDYQEATQVFEKALRVVPTSEEHSPSTQRLRLHYADCCVVIGRWDRSQREYQRILESLEVEGVELDQDSAELVVRSHLGMGEIYNMRGEPDLSRQEYGAARQVSEKHELGLWLAMAIACQAALAGKTGELDQARSLLEMAEKAGESHASEQGLTAAELAATIEAQWGLYYFRLARSKAAEERFEQALKRLHDANCQSLEEPSIHRYMGVMASLRRENRKALEHHLQALRLYTKAGCRYGQAKVYDSIGRTFLSANRLDEAIFTFKKSELLCRRLGANAELATLYGKLGQVAMLREDFEGAIRYFKRDLEISSRFRNYYALGYSYRNLGRCLLQISRFDEAVVNLTESLGLFQYVEDGMNLARVYMDLGFAHVKAGQLAEALEVCNKARALFQEHSLNREMAFLSCLEGMMARANGDQESSENHFLECIRSLGSNGSGSWVSETFFELGQLYQVQGRQSLAVGAFKSAVRTARGAGLSRQVSRYLSELENLNEIELFEVWMEDLPSSSESGEGQATAS